MLCVAGILGYLRFPRVTQGVTKTNAPGSPNQAARAIPVVAVPAWKSDMPVYLNGLGSVVAFNTVTIRSRVDGELVKVAFQEGQFVKEGDLLAEIDPRPFGPARAGGGTVGQGRGAAPQRQDRPGAL